MFANTACRQANPKPKALTIGADLYPLTPCHTEPPMHPIANAPPQSSRMRHGLFGNKGKRGRERERERESGRERQGRGREREREKGEGEGKGMTQIHSHAERGNKR